MLKNLLVLLLGFALGYGGFLGAKQLVTSTTPPPPYGEHYLTQAERLEDLDYLYNMMKENHPYIALKARTEGYDWLAHKAEFEQEIKAAKNDGEFVAALDGIVNSIGNEHTNILYYNFYEGYVSNWSGLLKLEEQPISPPEVVKYWTDAANNYLGSYRMPSFIARYYSGEYYVLGASDALKSRVPMGSKVVSINGASVHEYAASLRGRGHFLYDPVRKRIYFPYFWPDPDSGELTLEYVDPSGERAAITAPAGATIKWNLYETMPPFLATANGNLTTATFADGKVAYVHLQQMLYYGPKEQQDLHAFFETIKGTEALIIDIRGNGGGYMAYWQNGVVDQLSSSFWKSDTYITWLKGGYITGVMNRNLEYASDVNFIPKDDPRIKSAPPELASQPFGDLLVQSTKCSAANSVNYEGKIYLMVDDGVYSAAEAFSVFAKNTGWATLVGGVTGGDGVVGDIPYVVLPHSKIMIRFSGTLGLNPDGSANEEMHTVPDVLVEPTQADIVGIQQAVDEGKVSGPSPEYDPALAKAIELATRR